MECDAAKGVQAFVSDAVSYCSYIECLRDGKPENLYLGIMTRLSSLASSALSIPFDMPETDAFESKFHLTSDERAGISRLIHGTVAPEIDLLLQYNPDDDESEKTRRFMLFDDLADVYSDIKEGLRAFDTGSPEAVSEAIWQWKWDYENHWGSHLMRALMTTHEIRFKLFVE